MTTDNLLWWNKHHKPLPDAIDEACARFIQRVGLPPTNVILPPNGEWPETVGKLRVETSGLVRPWHLVIYSVYQMGDIVCMECGIVTGNNPAIQGVSHGYCLQCKAAALAEFEAGQVVRQSTMAGLVQR